ncbi:MAG: hypothetical protein ACUVRM_08810 [Bacillota bacterium]
MRRRWVKSLVVIGLLGLIAASVQAVPERIFPVELVNETESSVGDQLFTRLKSAVALSPNMILVSAYSDRWPRLVVIFGAVDDSPYSCAYKAIWTLQLEEGQALKYYLDSTLGICGTGRLAEVAENLYARTDYYVGMMIEIQDLIEGEEHPGISS